MTAVGKDRFSTCINPLVSLLDSLYWMKSKTPNARRIRGKNNHQLTDRETQAATAGSHE